MTLNELLELKYTNPSKYETALDAYYGNTSSDEHYGELTKLKAVGKILKCNMCSNWVPKKEYDPSLDHCLECHGG